MLDAAEALWRSFPRDRHARNNCSAMARIADRAAAAGINRGEVRGGRFVGGFMGEQFALPMAVESLRATCDSVATRETVTISAADPLNLVGILLPGNRVAANSGKVVTLPRDGVPVGN